VIHLIDTHAHLDDEQLIGEVPALLDRARAAGVLSIITVATTASSSAVSVRLAGENAGLLATVGLHPNNLAEAAPTAWDEVRALVGAPGVVALGETGLDRHWDTTPFAMQEDYFVRHLALSRQTGKPVVIHCRDAAEDMHRVLKAEFDRQGPLHGVMHSFTGDQALAEACLAMGLYLSFAGMLTYKNAAPLRQVAAQVPRDRLLVETDSPYLSPVPLRGKRNEPAHVIHTARCLAELHGMSLEAMAAQTTDNARRLFGLSGSSGRTVL
jgi:TatD DNase family protein